MVIQVRINTLHDKYSELKSIQYVKTKFMSLTHSQPKWTSCDFNSWEIQESVQACMMLWSQHQTGKFQQHWTQNKAGLYVREREREREISGGNQEKAEPRGKVTKPCNISNSGSIIGWNTRSFILLTNDSFVYSCWHFDMCATRVLGFISSLSGSMPPMFDKTSTYL